MHANLTIPSGVDSGAITLRDLPSCAGVTAAVDGGGFVVSALVVFDVVQDELGDDFVEVRRSRGAALAVEAGQIVVVQVERCVDEPAPAMLRVRGAGWEGADVLVAIGEVRTTVLTARPVTAPGRTVEIPVRLQTRGGVSTVAQYELAEPIPGITMVPQQIEARPGVDTLASLTFEVTTPVGLGPVTMRLLVTAFGGMQREVLAPITLVVRRQGTRPAAARRTRTSWRASSTEA